MLELLFSWAWELVLQCRQLADCPTWTLLQQQLVEETSPISSPASAEPSLFETPPCFLQGVALFVAVPNHHKVQDDITIIVFAHALGLYIKSWPVVKSEDLRIGISLIMIAA
jgi:hypothetical protein